MTDPEELTPQEIVRALDEYIIGQDAAKRSVAIALRNRYRRRQVKADIREEILPNNIIMIGPTGVGKTEIARRLARLAHAPFIKVEASKFTEVGYVGRDVDSMIRDLTEIGIGMVREEMSQAVRARADELVEERLLDALLPSPRPIHAPPPALDESAPLAGPTTEADELARRQRTREKLRQQLREGVLEEREIESDVEAHAPASSIEIFSSAGLEEMEFNLPEALKRILPAQRKRRRMKVSEARPLFREEATARLIDPDKLTALALDRVQNSGIVFIDEIDKICAASGARASAGPDVSREGVQRDLLPVVEGSTVSTRHGVVRTDHILFIAAGAFHGCKPSDLIPELQGRFPIRVELDTLSEQDFVRILTEPKNALLAQYRALLATDGVRLSFTPDAIARIARIATQVNEITENIGARRLHTVLTTLLEDVLFDAPEAGRGEVVVDAERVDRRLAHVLEDKDLSRYIL